MQLVVGLGNPGAEYAESRHNVGFMIVDSFGRRRRAAQWRRQHRARVAEVRFAGRRLTLALPMTFMNLSGQAVAPLARETRAAPAEILVVHDDRDLPEGTVRVKLRGGDAGHKGVRSITESLGDSGFLRLRIGIGRPGEGQSMTDFVLEPLGPEPRHELEETIQRGTAALESVLAQGPERAMCTINRKDRLHEEEQG